ncbi:MAG: hypothetical protein ACLGJB_08905 [Blastocatellia bacterium]
MMGSACNWDHCINHRGAQTQRFVADYFSQDDRRMLLVAGAGFDPRSLTVCEMIAANMGARAKGFFIREERPNPDGALVSRAEVNLNRMQVLLPANETVIIDVFAADGAAIGGRNGVLLIDRLSFKEITDIVVDFSALSIGVAFPIVSHLFSKFKHGPKKLNLHLMVTDEPLTDHLIVPTASDTAETIHGFKGGLGLDQNANAAKLWLPQLVAGRNAIFEKIHEFVKPHDVCPILPFPSSHPRLQDELIQSYSAEFESTWQVDTRNLVYAGEKNPLDLYRTILRIGDLRSRVFAEVGGSLIILSPIGSKVLAIGALMAAIERGFAVAHVEAIQYTVNLEEIDKRRPAPGEILHVWLSGETYPHMT